MKYNKYIKNKNYEALVTDIPALRELILDNKEKFDKLIEKDLMHTSASYCLLIISIIEGVEITEENIEDYAEKAFNLEVMFFDNLIILDNDIEEIINGSYVLREATEFDGDFNNIQFKDI